MSNCQNGTHRLYITVHDCWIRYVWLFLGRWLRLDREKNKKKRVQESPKVLPSSISTSNNYRAASSRCNWSWYSRNSSRSASSSKSSANWTCSPSKLENFELIQTFQKARSEHYKIDRKKTKKCITCGHVQILFIIHGDYLCTIQQASKQHMEDDDVFK